MNKESKKSGGIDMYGTIIKANQSLVRDNAYDEKRIEKMYHYPANLNEAQLHNLANKFGYNSKYIKGKQKAPLCPCCELPVNTVSIDLDYPTTPSQANVKAGAEKYKLNAGTSMLFTFIKMTIVYLGLRFFITDGYNLITNIFAQNCKDPKNISQCSTNFAAKFSNFNKSTNSDQIYLSIVDILNVITVVLSIIFFTIYRKYQYTIYCLADMSTHTQADYTIFVEKIPIILPKNFGNNRVSLDDCDYESQLKNIFEKYIKQWIKKIEEQTKEHPKNPNLNKLEHSLLDVQRAHPNFAYQPIVTSITLCFDLTQLQKLNYLREELMEKHKENIKNNISGDKNSQMHIPNQIEALNKEIIKLSKKFADQNSASFNLSHFVGKAFISFQYQHYKQYFLEYFKVDNDIKMLDNVLKISTAAEPSDVYWYNMRILSSQRTKSVVYSYLIMAVSLIISFGLLFGLEYYQLVISTKSIQTQLSVKTTKQIILSYSFTMLMTVSTTAINYILSFVIQKVTEFEKQKTKTDQIISLITKTVAAQFLNTAVIYYIISIAASNFLPPEKNSPLSDTGLVMKVTSLIAVSGFIQIMTNFVQFGQIFSSIMNKYKYSKQTTTNSFQVELNKLLQPTQFSFALRYSYYILNVYVVSFYSYIVPYISLILIVIFAIQYWVDKFNLFKRFSCPTDFNYRLSMFTLKIFECSIFFFALGNFLFAPTIHTNNRGSDYRIINIVSVSLAFVYCLAIFFLPKKWLQRVSHQTFEPVSYQTCIKQLYFNKVYWLLNPATTFANQPNINKPHQLIDYGQAINFAEESDFIIFENLVHQQNVKQDQDVYSPEEFRNFAEVLANNDLIKNYDNGDDNIFAQLAAASK